jgi:hypothetical protein
MKDVYGTACPDAVCLFVFLIQSENFTKSCVYKVSNLENLFGFCVRKKRKQTMKLETVRGTDRRIF